MNPIFEFRGVSKRFGENEVVRDISLGLESGRFYSLLGPSGCGKTTTLRLAAGFEVPDSGHILLRGEPINQKPPHLRDVSTVFQNYALFPHLSVERNVAFGLIERGERNYQTKLNEALEMVHLGSKRNRLPSQLSGGEKQRVALARSLVVRPSVLLLDEPLAALDLQLRKTMRQELKTLQKRTGITFLFVTHDQEEALAMSDEIAIMNNGVLEQYGTPESVYNRPKTRFVANFLGAMNWIGEVGIRPEALRIARDGGNRICRATVQDCIFLGNVTQVLLRMTSGDEVRAELPAQTCRPEIGEEVSVSWADSDEVRVAR